MKQERDLLPKILSFIVKQERNGIASHVLYLRKSERSRKAKKESGVRVVCRCADDHSPDTPLPSRLQVP